MHGVHKIKLRKGHIGHVRETKVHATVRPHFAPVPCPGCGGAGQFYINEDGKYIKEFCHLCGGEGEV